MRSNVVGIGLLVVAIELAVILVLLVGWLPARLERSQPQPARPAETDTVVELKNSVERLAFQLERGKTRDSDGKDVAKQLATALERLDELAAQVYESERDTRHNLRRIQQNILKRLRKLGAGGGADIPSDPKKAAAFLRAGRVELDEARGEARITGRIATPSRTLELVAGTEGGPLHEALLEVDCRPAALRGALLSLGCKTGSGADYRTGKQPTGTRLDIALTWEGLEKPIPLEDLLIDARTKKTMTGARWVFAGSGFDTSFVTGDEIYIPDESRVAIALTHNFSNAAVIACDQKDAANEQIWVGNGERMPHDDTVEITVILKRHAGDEADGGK